MQDEIEQHLAPLVGLPLCDASRAVDMARFGFGRRIEMHSRPGRSESCEYALHVQSQWRIVRDGAVLVGYGAWHYPPRRDDLVDHWVTHGPDAHIVREVSGTTTGDIAITFRDGCLLETFANSATPDSEGGHDEFWRLLPPNRGGDSPHLVVTAHGIDR